MSLSFNYAATKKLTLFADGYYVHSEEDYDRPRLDSIHSPNPWELFDASDFSDLESDEYRISGGFSYAFRKNISFLTRLTYADFDEDEYYMQDNEGSVFYVTAGLKWSF